MDQAAEMPQPMGSVTHREFPELRLHPALLGMPPEVEQR